MINQVKNFKFIFPFYFGIIQEPTLFSTTIMENIRFGKSNATDAEVIEAAKSAMAHDFIQLFPDGYQTIVGERGVTVSGLFSVFF